MPRTHALQSRSGEARPLAVRFTDEQLAALTRVSTRRGQSPSEYIRQAVDHDLLVRSQPMVSAFWTTYGATLEQLFVAGIRPVVVGLWAAVAHGFVAAAPCMQLVIPEESLGALESFFAARGTRSRSLPVRVGKAPWSVEFLSSWFGRAAQGISTESMRCGRIDVAVATLDELVSTTSAIPSWARQDLKALQRGTYRNDDGSRGEAAWDYAGRMNASAVYGTPAGGGLNAFVDFHRSMKVRVHG